MTYHEIPLAAIYSIAFLTGCRITVFNLSGATRLASDRFFSQTAVRIRMPLSGRRTPALSSPILYIHCLSDQSDLSDFKGQKKVAVDHTISGKEAQERNSWNFPRNSSAHLNCYGHLYPSTQLFISIAMVMGPTPPGTGVMAEV